MNYCLAIDGGGSKTKTVCADASGQAVGEGLSGATSLTATSVGAAGFSLRESIRQAIQNLPEDANIKIALMGLAGMDVEKEEQIAHKAFTDVISQFGIEKLVLVNDILIALESGTSSPNAIALIAGTGSNCYGRNQNNQEVKIGGMDFLLTDQGSGYAIGRRTLREAIKSYDGRSPKSILEEMVCRHFDITSVTQLKEKVYNPLISKTQVAEVAVICFEAQAQGDKVAEQILKDSVFQLLIMARTAMSRLNLAQVSADCVLTGRVAKQPFIQQLLISQLQADFPQLRVIVPEHGPVYGALKMALRMLGQR